MQEGERFRVDLSPCSFSRRCVTPEWPLSLVPVSRSRILGRVWPQRYRRFTFGEAPDSHTVPLGTWHWPLGTGSSPVARLRSIARW